MTKFDFKQWIVDNKAANKKVKQRNKILSENMGMLNEAPPNNCATGGFGNLGCEAWNECGTGALWALHFSSANYTNTWFHGTFAGSPGNGAVRKFTNSSTGQVRKFTYAGVNTNADTLDLGDENDWTSSNCCDCTCIYGCTDPLATGGNNLGTATCDDGSCTYLGSGYDECINCCCNAHSQQESVMENTNPTIDAISKLIQLSEQSREERPEKRPDRRDDRRRDDRRKDRDGKIRPSDDIKHSSAAPPPPTGDPMVAGPCSAAHYSGGTGQPWTLQDTTAPDPLTIDPATGLCECDPLGYPTVASIMNPSPQTVDANNDPVGSSAPCP